MKRYLLNHLIAFDQWVNVLLRGDPDESLSSRAHRMRLKGHRWWGWTAKAINALFFWQTDHCRGAFEAEALRLQMRGVARIVDG